MDKGHLSYPCQKCVNKPNTISRRQGARRGGNGTLLVTPSTSGFLSKGVKIPENEKKTKLKQSLLQQVFCFLGWDLNACN